MKIAIVAVRRLQLGYGRVFAREHNNNDNIYDNNDNNNKNNNSAI